MKIVSSLIASLVWVATSVAQEYARGLPTWEHEAGKGLVPYHQLTADDFVIDDHVHPESGFWIKPFIDPHYRYISRIGSGGYVYVYVTDWVVFSGLDKTQSSRKSKIDMNAGLPYAQALLDLNEIYARQLASLKTGDLPRGGGPSVTEAAKDLVGQIKVFLNKKYERLQTESAALAKATNRGQDKVKVRELADGIRKRLDALPKPTPAPAAPISATPRASATTPMPAASSSPK